MYAKNADNNKHQNTCHAREIIIQMHAKDIKILEQDMK